MLEDMKFSKEELQLIAEALQFTACGDVCTDVNTLKAKNMGDLSVIICNKISFKSTDNYYCADLQPDDEEHLNIIKDYIRAER
jgi:hypothetical protein